MPPSTNPTSFFTPREKEVSQKGYRESSTTSHQNQMNSGLTRYRSAPSSYFANIIDREFCEEFFNRPSSPETERILTRFIAGSGGGGNGGTEVTNTSEVAATEASSQQTQFMASMNNEAAGVLQQQQSNYGSASQNFYQGPPRPPLPNSSVEGSYSMGLDRLPQMKTGGGNNSSLIRHSSSPAGLFANINVGEDFTSLADWF
ncbi:transcription factor bhlh122 [Quercus suber]|uniref:Transcription factor bhlh122 n=2 Tax=Quercus suber TaxID=58331 RepID=A0AAW0M7I0_QUESU